LLFVIGRKKTKGDETAESHSVLIGAITDLLTGGITDLSITHHSNIRILRTGEKISQ